MFLGERAEGTLFVPFERTFDPVFSQCLFVSNASTKTLPSGRMHAYFNRTFFGESLEHVGDLMDSTTQLHPGYRHRQDFVHSPQFIAMFARSDKEIAAAILHERLDRSGMTVKQSQKLERAWNIDNKAYRYRAGKYRTVNRKRKFKT